jgi:DNA-directed RNA polymerase subunit RPC12/RpoP
MPEILPCPGCGEELEFWTDEEEITCKGCGHRITRILPPVC